MLEIAQFIYDIFITQELIRNALWAMSKEMLKKHESIVGYSPVLSIKLRKPDP